MSSTLQALTEDEEIARCPSISDSTSNPDCCFLSFYTSATSCKFSGSSLAPQFNSFGSFCNASSEGYVRNYYNMELRNDLIALFTSVSCAQSLQ